MREIKFRVWDINTKLFYRPKEYGDYQGHYHLNLNGEFTRFASGVGGKEVVVQQCTGLKDKTGKDIYEGDIVRYVEKMHEHGDSQVLTATVIYDNDYGAWGLGKNEEHIWNYFLDFTVVKNSVEVLGNIFENKDLLK